jgi:hypothetical protein
LSVVRVLMMYDQIRNKRSPPPKDLRKLEELAARVVGWPTTKENKEKVRIALEWARSSLTRH